MVALCGRNRPVVGPGEFRQDCESDPAIVVERTDSNFGGVVGVFDRVDGGVPETFSEVVAVRTDGSEIQVDPERRAPGLDLVERRATVFRTAFPLSVPGAVVAAYHSWLRWTAGGRCTLDGGCATVQRRVLGLSVPNLSLVAFLLITGISAVL